MVATPQWVLDATDWEHSDEDWVRDAFLSLNSYGRWRLTGENRFTAIAPWLEVGRAHADEMAYAASYLSGACDYIDGWTIPHDVKDELRRALERYVSLRRREDTGRFR